MSHTAARASARRSSSPAPPPPPGPRWSFAPTMPVRAAVPTVHTRQGRRSHADIIGLGHGAGSSRQRQASPSPSPSPSPSSSSARIGRPSLFRDPSPSPSRSRSSSPSPSPSSSHPSTPRSRNDSRAMHGLLSMEPESDPDIDAIRSFVSSASRSRPVAPHLAQRHDQLLSQTGSGSGSGPTPAYPLHRMSNGSSSSSSTSSSASASPSSSQHSSRASSMQSSPIQSPRQGNGNSVASRVMSRQRSSSMSSPSASPSPSPSTPSHSHSHSQTRSHSPFPRTFCDEWHQDMLSQFHAMHEAMNSMWEDAVTMFAQPISMMHMPIPMMLGHSSPSHNRPGTPTRARASSQSQSQSQAHIRNIPIQRSSHPPQSPARSSMHPRNHPSSPSSHSRSHSTSWIIPWHEHDNDNDSSALEDAMVWATYGRDDTGDIDVERMHHHHHHHHHHHDEEDEDHIMDWFEQQGLPSIRTPRARSTHHQQVEEDSWYPLDYDSLLRLDEGVKKVGVERHRLQRIQSQQRPPARHELKETCQICLDEYSVSCRVVTLPVCAHLFHVECITKWLSENKTCPTCRNQLL